VEHGAHIMELLHEIEKKQEHETEEKKTEEKKTEDTEHE
jgi:hypothetical protein